MFVLLVTEGEAIDKAPAAISGSGVKFEEGLGTTEEDVSAPIEETGEQPDGWYLTKVGFKVLILMYLHLKQTFQVAHSVCPGDLASGRKSDVKFQCSLPD